MIRKQVGFRQVQNQLYVLEFKKIVTVRTRKSDTIEGVENGEDNPRVYLPWHAKDTPNSEYIAGQLAPKAEFLDDLSMVRVQQIDRVVELVEKTLKDNFIRIL